jgi:aminocarboxymuconate-semialdehyde decarboxylase
MADPDLETFSCASSGTAAAGSGTARQLSGRRDLFTVDIHCHVLSKRAQALAQPHFRTELEPTLAFATDQTRAINKRQGENLTERMTVATRRLVDMDAAGIDVQAISPAPTQYYYWLDAELARETSRMINDDIAAMAASDPRRFVAMGTVPLQDARLAVEEMRRCVGELGMRGIEINSHVCGEELAAPRLAPFFAAAEALGVLLFMHPLGFTEGARLARHYFNNVIGNPLESTIAVSHLIFEGVFERHPKLCMCVAHGGGYLPGYFGRMDHAHGARDDCRVNISRPPSDYLKQLYFDTVVFDPEQLAYMARRFGSDHLLLGTDYPYDMAEADPVNFILSAPGLSAEDHARICGGNAARLLGISRQAT